MPQPCLSKVSARHTVWDGRVAITCLSEAAECAAKQRTPHVQAHAALGHGSSGYQGTAGLLSRGAGHAGPALPLLPGRLGKWLLRYVLHTLHTAAAPLPSVCPALPWQRAGPAPPFLRARLCNLHLRSAAPARHRHALGRRARLCVPGKEGRVSVCPWEGGARLFVPGKEGRVSVCPWEGGALLPGQLRSEAMLFRGAMLGKVP